MPYKLIKHKDGMYSVKNLRTGQYHSNHTTFQNAISQIRLLLMLEHRR